MGKICLLRILYLAVQRVLDDSTVVRLRFLRDAADHTLAHLEKAIELEPFAFPYIGVMIGGLDHQ